MTHRYPFAPLVEAMGCSANQAIIRLGISGKSGQEYRQFGLSEKVADRLAVRAGLHPFEVWPDMAEANLEAATIECAAEGCTERFIPTRKGHEHCSKRCSERTWARRKYRTDPAFAQAKRASAARYYAEAGDYVRRRSRRRYAERTAA